MMNDSRNEGKELLLQRKYHKAKKFFRGIVTNLLQATNDDDFTNDEIIWNLQGEATATAALGDYHKVCKNKFRFLCYSSLQLIVRRSNCTCPHQVIANLTKPKLIYYFVRHHYNLN